ncbi:transketolase [Herbivorax sp. ANBcel31]|uniref:transketolase n=1 Tax=Herbivorax sp. ANBcel31 TaxID=3069754 RepID=UPI0027B0FA44|nr:transketolase [Herbivorax sp. ANBcel31]MDQ2085193.1 transketolase [Herbivorax sp. ANBcel31]
MKSIEEKIVNTMRILSIEGVEKAKSGHPGLPLGAAPIGYTIWSKHLKHNKDDIKWFDRDRFILSAGHGSMLLYSLLYLFGYPLSLEDLKSFRQWESKTPGHPEFGITEGVEATTGPLGQGFANGVGMAIAEAFLAKEFNEEGFNIIDHYTYVLNGDGCMMEGISYEAASLAGKLGLGKLIALYDSNNITIEGSTDLAFTEDVGARFKSMKWQVIEVKDGNDVDAIDKAIINAKNETQKPSMIIVNTKIGYGCPDKEGSEEAHGAPLGADNILETKKNLGWEYKEEFFVPAEVSEQLESIKRKKEEEYKKWLELWNGYSEKYPQKAKKLNKWLKNDFSFSDKDVNDLITEDTNSSATRADAGQILNKLSDIFENLVGGSADLNPSTKTYLKGKEDFNTGRPGRNIHFGVREHAMGAVANGISYHGGLRPFVSTFFVFSDYMKPSIRLSAISKLPVMYLFTHDSIGVGEDGPTHQPVEHLAALRSMPGLITFRPADKKETFAGLTKALSDKEKPYAIMLSRQKLKQIETSSLEAQRGAYIILGSVDETPDIILLASGSEIGLVYEAGEKLRQDGVLARVVSVPSFELFDMQDKEYKNKILPKSVKKRLAVESGSSFGWEKYIGLDGTVIAIDTFGASAPADRIFKEYGFSLENILKVASELLKS